MSYNYLETIWLDAAKKVTIPVFLRAIGDRLSDSRTQALRSKENEDVNSYLGMLDCFKEAYLYLAGRSGVILTPLKEDAEILVNKEHRRFSTANHSFVTEGNTVAFKAFSIKCAESSPPATIPEWAQDPFSQTERLGILPTITDLLKLKTEKASLVRVGRFR